MSLVVIFYMCDLFDTNILIDEILHYTKIDHHIKLSREIYTLHKRI